MRKFHELFSNGALPKNLWTYLAFALMYLFHKLMLEERIDPKDPDLRHVTVGSVLTRFGCRVMVRMNKIAVAAQLLMSHQFSFGINGGVQQVIMGCTLALQVHPSFVQIDLDLRNAHTFCSGDRIEEELESDIIYNYLLESFRALYGKTITPQWHYGDGPDRPPTSCHMSIDGLRQEHLYEGLSGPVWKRFGALLHHHGPRGGPYGLPGISGTCGYQRGSPILRLDASPLRPPLRLR